MTSHTLYLLEETFREIEEFNYKRHVEFLKNFSDKYRRREKKHIVNRILERFGLHLLSKKYLDHLLKYNFNWMNKWSAIGTLELAIKYPERFDEVYILLSDEDSKKTFDWFIKYRVAYAMIGKIAGELFKPAIKEEEYIKLINNLKIRRGFIDIQNFIFKSDPYSTIDSCSLEQYSYKDKCEVSNGDIVIDGGAFRGETSFWLISKGARKVYAFEPDPYNFSILCENVNINKLNDRIIPIQRILSNKEGEEFTFLFTGSGSSSIVNSEKENNFKISSITIDNFVVDNRLESVDFIKLDVEGSELDVLQGAVNTIKKFKSKLAISVYHKPDDILTITCLIKSILPNAKYYLSHKSYELNETILFVNPRDSGDKEV